MNRGEILRVFFRHFPLFFHFNFFASIKLLFYSGSPEISQQNTLFNMQIVNKKGEGDSLCKISHAKCFRTKIFDRFHQGMSRRHGFRILLQNSEFQFICNRQFLVVCSYLSSTLICENTLLLSCLDKRKKFIERRVMEKYLLGGKGTLIFLSNMLNASLLKTIQHKLASIQNISVF